MRVEHEKFNPKQFTDNTDTKLRMDRQTGLHKTLCTILLKRTTY